MKKIHIVEGPDADGIRQAMGYLDGTKCCKSCKFFEPCDQSGNNDALAAHCKRNAFGFLVDEAGYCDHFAKK